MSDWAVLGSVFAVHLLAMVSPGPNVLVVTQTAASEGRRAGVRAALGIAAGAAMLSSAALAGVSVLMTQFAWLHAALRVLGGGYLLYLGVRLWRSAAARAAFCPATANGIARSDWRAFQIGLATNLTNPKALVFYGSVFAALFAPDTPLWVKLAAVGMIAANSTGFHVALACLFSTPRAQAGYQRIKPWIDGAAGTALALLGLQLLLRSR